MELSALAVVLIFKLLYLFLWMELIRSLHHTGLMLMLEELEISTIVRPLILVFLLEQPVK